MSSVEVKSFANADEINDNFNNAKIEADVKKEVIDLCSSFPIYSN